MVRTSAHSFSLIILIIFLQITKSTTRQAGEISKQKCIEFSKYRIQKIPNPTLLADAEEKFIEEEVCAIRVTELIIGGELAIPKEFPHMAILGFAVNHDDSNLEWTCGGSLISENFVLTAAHCLSTRENKFLKFVRIGTIDLKQRKRGEIIEIAETFKHPNYRKSPNYANDIALLRLVRLAKMTPAAHPICLYTTEATSAKKAIVSGFGNTGDSDASDVLLKTVVQILPEEKCRMAYTVNSFDARAQICCGGKELDGVTRDTCRGDSGGPLQIYHTKNDSKCMYDLIGLTSFGKGNCGGYSVYVRVSHYIKWIEDIVWPE